MPLKDYFLKRALAAKKTDEVSPTATAVIKVPDPDAMTKLGQDLAQICRPPMVIYLRGEIGMGKTTLIRAFLQAAGVSGRIKSPSYALLEAYEVNKTHYVHVDLYRLNDPEELIMLGIRDYLTSDTILAIEWPEQGGSVIPKADLVISIKPWGTGREVTIKQGGDARALV